jgi:hypothetical protein
MTKSVFALLLMAAIITAAHLNQAYATEASRDWGSETRPTLFLPKYFEQVPWLSVKPPSPRVNTDLLIGPNLEKMEAFKLKAPFSQFSTTAKWEPRS